MPESSSSTNKQIYVVDDDVGVRRTLTVLLTTQGYEVICFSDAASFLRACQEHLPACILLDVYMPGISGLDLLQRLDAHSYPCPIFIMSGRGDIPTAVSAMKFGALDFIEKPFRGPDVVVQIRSAIEAEQRFKNADDKDRAVLRHIGGDRLTRRESQVLARLVAGATNKGAARDLGISPRTVETHRARIISKLGAKNLADVMRMAIIEKAKISDLASIGAI